MEEKPLPPVTLVSSDDESNSLDAVDVNAPVSSFSLAQKNYPLETLEVRTEGDGSTKTDFVTSTIHANAFSRRRAMIISLAITMLVVVMTGAAVGYVLRKNNTRSSSLIRDIPTQEVNIKERLPDSDTSELINEQDALLVNGDIISRGNIKVTDESFSSIIETDSLSDNRTFRLPNTSGTLCLDSNNCNYATRDQQAILQTQLNGIQTQLGGLDSSGASIQASGVNAINSQSGTLSIQGVTNRISVTNSGGIIQISTPQALAVTSSPSFSSLSLSGGLNVSGAVTTGLDCSAFANGGSLTTNGAGKLLCSDDDGIASGVVTTSGGSMGTIPLFSGTQSIDNSIISQTGNTVDVAGTLTLTNALGVSEGGTGLTGVPVSGQILIGNGGGYNLATLTQGSGIAIANGAGSISIAATLGTDIVSSEIQDGTILETDISSSNGPVDNWILSYDLGSGGFTWIDPASLVGQQVDSLNSLNGSVNVQGTVGEVLATDNGVDTITLSLDANVSQLGQTIGNSEIENDSVQLGTQTTGQYVANFGVPTGLGLSGNSGEGSMPVLSVLYGSGANTAVQGNVTLQCPSGTGGNLTGGGNAITLGSGGSCNAIQTVTNPTFLTSVGTPQLVLLGSANDGTLVVGTLGQDVTYTLPDPGQSIVDICLSTGNCIGGSGSAPASASYLTLGTTGSLSSERVLTMGTNLSATDGGVNGNLTINVVNSPTFSGAVTTPEVKGTGSLGLSSSGVGIGGSISLTTNSISMSVPFGTIELHNNTSIDYDLNVQGLVSIGNTSASNSRHIARVSHTFNSGNACNLGICSGFDSIVTLGSSAPSPGSVAAFSGATYADTGAVLPDAYGMLINSAGGTGTIQTNTGIYVANQTAGTINDYGLYVAGADTYSLYVETGTSYLDGDLIVTGQATFGTSGSAGLLKVYDGTSNTGSISTASLSSNRTYTLPDADGTICLTSGNCIGGSGSAPASADYLLLSNNSNLSSERRLLLGSNLSAVDGGANGSYTISTTNSPNFSGQVSTPQIAGGTSLILSGGMGSVNITAIGGGIFNQAQTTIQTALGEVSALRVLRSSDSAPAFWVDADTRLVGIGTASAPSNRLNVNTLLAADSSAQLAVATAGTSNKGIIVQGVSGQTGDLFQAQDYTGAALAKISSSGNLTVVSATINGTLTINGNTTINGHIISGNVSGSTSVTAGSAADCSSTGSTSLSGDDIAGTITITTGTGSCSTGVLANVTFANAYGVSPVVILSPKNSAGASLEYYDSSVSNTTFTIDTATIPSSSTIYRYNYHVIQ